MKAMNLAAFALALEILQDCDEVALFRQYPNIEAKILTLAEMLKVISNKHADIEKLQELE